jgi:predicted nucleic acid-binding protein
MSLIYVLDCSATLPWLFEDEATEKTDRLLNRMQESSTAWVPSLWHLELGNALLVCQRRKRLDTAGMEAFLSAVSALDIQVDGETMGRAWNKTLTLASQYNLSLYDAAYLELALRRGLPLATLDTQLIETARNCGLELCLQS